MKKISLIILVSFLLSSCSIDMIEIKNKKQSARDGKIEKLKFSLAKKTEKLKNTNIKIKLTKKDLIILNKELELYSKNIEMNNSYKKMLALDIEKTKMGSFKKNKNANKSKTTNDKPTEAEFEVSAYEGKPFFYSHNNNITPGSIYVQIGAFATIAFAKDYKAKAISNGFENTQIFENGYHHVLVGNYTNFNDAYKAKNDLKKIGFTDAYIKKYR